MVEPLPLPPPLPPAARTHAAPGVIAALGLILLYFVLQVVVGFTTALVLGLALRVTHPGSAIDIAALMARADMRGIVVMCTVLGAAAITLWLAHARWPQSWSQGAAPGFGFVRPTLPWCLVAVVIGVVLPLVAGKLTQVLAQHHTVTQDVKQLGGSLAVDYRIAFTLLVATIGPVVEELLFRGVLLGALLRRLREAWAVLLSAALFALVHLPDLGWLWYALPNLVLLGIALAWLRLRSRSLWPAVIAHACNNLLAMGALFVMTQHAG